MQIVYSATTLICVLTENRSSGIKTALALCPVFCALVRDSLPCLIPTALGYLQSSRICVKPERRGGDPSN